VKFLLRLKLPFVVLGLAGHQPATSALHAELAQKIPAGGRFQANPGFPLNHLYRLIDRVGWLNLEDLLQSFCNGHPIALRFAIVLGQQQGKAAVAVLPHIVCDGIPIHPHHIGYLPMAKPLPRR